MIFLHIATAITEGTKSKQGKESNHSVEPHEAKQWTSGQLCLSVPQTNDYYNVSALT